MLIDEDPLGQVKFVRLFKVAVLNLHVIMMKPAIKLIISAAKLSQLTCHVCCCYGISVHENNHDTSRRQKRFHTIWSQNTLQIFAVTPVELADCYFQTVIFPALSLRCRKYQSVVNINLAKKLSPYFAIQCASPPKQAASFSPQHYGEFSRYLALLKNGENFTNWLTRVVMRKFMFHYKY